MMYNTQIPNTCVINLTNTTPSVHMCVSRPQHGCLLCLSACASAPCYQIAPEVARQVVTPELINHKMLTMKINFNIFSSFVSLTLIFQIYFLYIIKKNKNRNYIKRNKTCRVSYTWFSILLPTRYVEYFLTTKK